ncbi:hypothetical protein [Sphingomonas sp.]|uniref:hypothetical protein n=1 Tax=Sphingomonas sp. TaxID=28214 RepID=UPI002CADBF14|nr:hypothetical protein [Sphingomonas sp.]HWK34978.1 hypothetical protein [Sphingomonas sp.]
MSTAPVLAQPATPNAAAKLSVASAKDVRAASATKKSSKLAPAVIIGVLATVAIIGGAIALADNDDDPDSP